MAGITRLRRVAAAVSSVLGKWRSFRRASSHLRAGGGVALVNRWGEV
jgi:hypothetical protein